MARVNGYSGAFGTKVLQAVSQLQTIKANLTRAKSVADEITGGGVTLTNLEGTTVEFGTIGSGLGATFYNDLVSIITGLNSIAATALTDLDQG